MQLLKHLFVAVLLVAGLASCATEGLPSTAQVAPLPPPKWSVDVSFGDALGDFEVKGVVQGAPCHYGLGGGHTVVVAQGKPGERFSSKKGGVLNFAQVRSAAKQPLRQAAPTLMATIDLGPLVPDGFLGVVNIGIRDAVATVYVREYTGEHSSTPAGIPIRHSKVIRKETFPVVSGPVGVAPKP